MNIIKNMNFDIKPSKIHGVGVFAIKNISKGTIVFKYPYTQLKDIIIIPINKLIVNGISLSQIRVLKKWFAHTKTHIQIPKEFDPYTIHIVSLINHNIKPNVVYKNGIYYAKTNIKKNTEITIDYTHNNYSEGIDF
jgi:SET domain-containing protein